MHIEPSTGLRNGHLLAAGTVAVAAAIGGPIVVNLLAHALQKHGATVPPDFIKWNIIGGLMFGGYIEATLGVSYLAARLSGVRP